MSDLQTLIRDHYDHMVEPVSAVEAMGRTVHRDNALEGRRRPVARGVLVAAAAAAVVTLLIAGVPLLLSQPDSTPVVDDSLPLVPASEIEWIRIPGDQRINGPIVAAGQGFAGTRYRIEHPDDGGNPIYTGTLIASPDGVSWSAVDTLDLGDADAISWWSGNEWGAAGIIQNTADGTPLRDSLVLSQDGNNWILSDVSSAIPESARGGVVVGAAWGEPGIVAIHWPSVEAEPSERFVLFSPDGVSWARVADSEPLGAVRQVAASDIGFLMLEDRADPRPGRAWYSADGITWTETSTPGGQSTGVITGWTEGFLVITEEFEDDATFTTQTLWQSSDGQTWTELDVPIFDELVITTLRGSSMGLMATAIPMHDHEGEGEEVVEISQHLLYSADGVEWVDWLVEDTFAINEIGGFAIGTDRMVGSVFNAEESDLEGDGDLVFDIWIGSGG